ncbi:hypothetical protein M378DRAFT_96038 [Amanita muscaria Koide BX008]|uniref:Rhodanese domain-containing protein n=1 Tax=Amanita muscaria (strain Koide BX008) TaxID=946122 RepID=A0A0C2XPH5_AMAMK|nr:hypothetical protein M378DRAFT_96038 [Amanita muscaria Koide BX008]
MFLNSIRALPTRSFIARTMSSKAAPLLLTPTQVRALTKSNDSSVRLLDATWIMPNWPGNPRQEFAARRLPGARFLDLDEVASPHELGMPHMMPSARMFADACEKFGIEPSSHVIIYDTRGVFSSPRALFMFRSFGHTNSSIIDGGLPLWHLEGFPIDEGSPSPVEPSTYPTPTLNTDATRSYEQIVSNSTLDPATDPTAELVLDARSKGRFLGTDPEPRPGMSSGHIPHSLSLQFNDFLKKHTSEDGTEYTTFLPPSELRDALENAIGSERAELVIKGKIPVVTSCGSGMTAGILWLGLKLLSVNNISIYDESWLGYAMRSTSKIEKAT